MQKLVKVRILCVNTCKSARFLCISEEKFGVKSTQFACLVGALSLKLGSFFINNLVLRISY